MSGNFPNLPSANYTPYVCTISAVSSGVTTTVTTEIDHSFVQGGQVQFIVPSAWGMRQLDGLKSYVSTVPTSTSFTVPINSLQFDPFVTPTPPNVYYIIQNPQVIGIGDQNSGYVSPGGVPPINKTPSGAFAIGPT